MLNLWQRKKHHKKLKMCISDQERQTWLPKRATGASSAVGTTSLVAEEGIKSLNTSHSDPLPPTWIEFWDIVIMVNKLWKDLLEHCNGILALQAMSSLRSWDVHPVQENENPANASVVLLHRAHGRGYLHCSSFFGELYGHFFDALFRPPSLKLCPLPSICGLVHTLPFCHGPHSRKKWMEPFNIFPTFCWQNLTPGNPLLVGPSRQNLFWEIKHQPGCSIKGMQYM